MNQPNNNTMKALRFAIPLTVFLALCVLFYSTLDRDTQLLPSPLIGQPVPEFSLPSLVTNETELLKINKSSQDLHTKIINQNSFAGEKWVLNIWASWCAACRIEHPLFNEIAKQTDWNLVGLNYKDQADEARQWLTELKNPYQNIIFDIKGTLGLDLGVYGVPETFLIDAQGMIQHKHVGPICENIIHELITPFFLDKEINPNASCE